jgi:hypothetical protein
VQIRDLFGSSLTFLKHFGDCCAAVMLRLPRYHMRTLRRHGDEGRHVTYLIKMFTMTQRQWGRARVKLYGPQGELEHKKEDEESLNVFYVR